jgi:hypothetical protein
VSHLHTPQTTQETHKLRPRQPEQDAPPSDGVKAVRPLRDLVARAKEQRAVRSDFEQSDLFLMQMALAAIIERTRA